jgi:hypothetical protein
MTQQKFQGKFHKDVLLKATLKHEDRIKIPTDQNFFDSMHNNIMAAIENLEVHKADKWSKPWVFLEPTLDLNAGAVKLNTNKFSNN